MITGFAALLSTIDICPNCKYPGVLEIDRSGKVV